MGSQCVGVSVHMCVWIKCTCMGVGVSVWVWVWVYLVILEAFPEQFQCHVILASLDVHISQQQPASLK